MIVILMMPLVYCNVECMKSGKCTNAVKHSPDPKTSSEKIVAIVFDKAPNIMAKGQYDRSG